jgi:ABC-type ATPase with predicted acetyltransferase domain
MVKSNGQHGATEMFEGMIKRKGHKTIWVEGRTRSEMRRKMTQIINMFTTDSRGVLHTSYRRFQHAISSNIEVCIIDQSSAPRGEAVARDER